MTVDGGATIGSGPAIRDLESKAELDECVALQKLIWGADFNELVPKTMLDLSRKLGGVVAGAFVGDRLVGFVFGLTGLYEGSVAHWSDMLAVRPDARDRGIGGALKRYQRRRLLERGIDTVYWTFEPLEARNAHFNFARLGCTASRYIRHFYESSDSPLHDTIGTDRLLVRWQLASPRVEARLNGTDPGPAPEDIASIPLVNGISTDGGPSPPVIDLDDASVRIAIPAGIQTLKRRDPALALEWRSTTREAFEEYLGRGYDVVEAVRVGDNEVNYILAERPA